MFVFNSKVFNYQRLQPSTSCFAETMFFLSVPFIPADKKNGENVDLYELRGWKPPGTPGVLNVTTVVVGTLHAHHMSALLKIITSRRLKSWSFTPKSHGLSSCVPYWNGQGPGVLCIFRLIWFISSHIHPSNCELYHLPILSHERSSIVTNSSWLQILTLWWPSPKKLPPFLEPWPQWEFQDPKLEVLYHIRPYFVGIFPYNGHRWPGWRCPTHFQPSAALASAAQPRRHGSGDEKKLRADLPSGYVKIAIENGHLWWVFPLKMVIFHSYVSLPEGSSNNLWCDVVPKYFSNVPFWDSSQAYLVIIQ